MKRNFLLLAAVFIMCSGGMLCAQSDSKALTLETVCAHLAEKPNTTGDFTQIKTLSANGRKLKSSGKYIFCQEGIMWKTEKPIPSSLILTKDTMVQISANGSKSVMNGNDNQIFANISETLSSVFSGNVTKLKKNFNCDFKITKDTGSNYSWAVILTPKIQQLLP